MKRQILLLFLSCTILYTCAPEKIADAGALVIENVSIIDPVNGQKDKQTVIISNGKIQQVLPSADYASTEADTLIDGSGKFLIPGLWDAHVHFAYIEELAPKMFNLFLGYGITSVRDTGGKIKVTKFWKDKAKANPKKAPRVMIAGPLLDGEPNVYDGSSPLVPELSVGLETVEDAVKMVDELDSIGVDLLKAYEMLSPEQFLAIMDRAKEKGLKVTGHIPLSMDVITASNAGLHSMEHMRNIELSTATNMEALLAQRRKLLFDGQNDPGNILRTRIHEAQRYAAVRNQDEAQTQKVIEALARNNTWQNPTLTLGFAPVERPFERPEWQASFEYLPEQVRKNWKEGIETYAATKVSEDRKVYRKWFSEIAYKLHEGGVTLMSGTDTPIFFLTPGLSLHEELINMVKIGLSPKEALATATTHPAKYFDMEEELGLVQTGMWADLILLDANPLEDISNTQKINTVIKQGAVYDRSALDQLLAEN